MTSERRLSNFSKKASVVGKAAAGAEGQHPHKEKKKAKHHVTLLKYVVAWIAYVLLGSWLFLVLERTSEEQVTKNEKWTRYKELVQNGMVVEELRVLKKHLNVVCPHFEANSSFDDIYSRLAKNASLNVDPELKIFVADWISEVEEVCSASLSVVEQITRHSGYTYVDAIYYTMTLVTTIGFGYIYPKTAIGRSFCIPYALIGVPLTCILMAKSSELLSNKMLLFYETTKKRYRKHPKVLLGIVTWLFLILGFFVFMFLPSLVFASLENWSYVDAIYFTFITLSTIGFGDLVAAYGGEPKYYTEMYKLAVVVWIMIALGYWIFLLNFLQKAIKSNAKTLKKTFVAKNLFKQADFLKQLITKVKQQEDAEDEEDDYDRRIHMMALIVESLSGSAPDVSHNKSLSSLPSNRTGLSRTSITCRSAKQSGKVPQDRLQLMTMMVEALWMKPANGLSSATVASESQSFNNFEDLNVKEVDAEDRRRSFQKIPSISFQELMNVKVAVKTEAVPGFHSLIQQSVSRENILDPGGGGGGGDPDESHAKVFNEVELPLKDVLSIVLTVASIDEEVQLKLQQQEDSQSEVSASSSTGPAIDMKESVPLLRSILVSEPADKTPNGINPHDKHKQQPQLPPQQQPQLDHQDASGPLSADEDVAPKEPPRKPSFIV